MDASAENKNKYVALGLTLGFHGLIFLLLIFIVFITPIPPFPDPPQVEIIADLGGMEGLGNADAGGSGQHDKDLTTSPAAAVNNVTNVTSPNMITDETETDASVHTDHTSKTDPKTDAVEEPKPSSE